MPPAKRMLAVNALLALAAVSFIFWQFAAPDVFRAGKAATMVSDRVVGRRNAPISVIEFSSLTCGECAKTHLELRKALAPFIRKNLANYAFRDLNMDANAFALAKISRCISADGYYDFIAKVFKKPRLFAPIVDDAKNRKFLANLFDIAAEFSLGKETAENCLANKSLTYDMRRMRSLSEAVYGLNFAPTIIIGDRKIEGFRPRKELAAMIEAAIAEKRTDFGKIIAY